MKIFTSRSLLSTYIDEERGKGCTIGFVPTMGALHEGHISLVERCRRECGVTVVSIFVNPTQFNDPNDLRNYPRTEREDLAMLEIQGVDAVLVPSVEEIYPEPDQRIFDFGRIDKLMEGTTRPGHFNGVAQVVSRLFDIVRPDKAYFGKKDFQQIAVIKALVAQQGYDIEIVECPIKRDVDGLALSSRNTLLNSDVRSAAPLIYSTLCKAVDMRPGMSPAQVGEWVAGQINANDNLKTIYFEIVDPLTLEKISSWDGVPNPQGCIAVQAGAVRLIDNIEF